MPWLEMHGQRYTREQAFSIFCKAERGEILTQEEARVVGGWLVHPLNLSQLGHAPYVIGSFLMQRQGAQALDAPAEERELPPRIGGDGVPVASCLICGHQRPLSTWVSGTRHGVCQECRAGAEKAQSQALDAGGWQPMDSAPKDGTVVIGWGRGDGPGADPWVEKISYFFGGEGIPEDAHCWTLDNDGTACEPEGWQPLPAPPGDAGGWQHERKDEEKDDRAGLIGQPIPDVVGTEPRLSFEYDVRFMSTHQLREIITARDGDQCAEAAKPETGPMRDAESPSGVQELGSSGLALAIEDIRQLHAGARRVEEHEDGHLHWLWRGKAIAYETVLGRLSRVGSGNPATKEQAVATGRSEAQESNSHLDPPAPPGDHP